MKQESTVKIYLDPVDVMLNIGVDAHEQGVDQRVVVETALYADVAYMKDVSVDTIIDYGLFYQEILSWAGRPQVLLIEDYLKEFAEFCFAHKRVTACRICIHKRDIFGKDQGAGVALFTSRADWLQG